MDVSDFTEIFNGKNSVYYYKPVVNYVFYINVGSVNNISYSVPALLLSNVNKYQMVNIEVCDHTYCVLSILHEQKLGFDKLNLSNSSNNVYMKYNVTISQLEDAYNLLRKHEGLPEINYNTSNNSIFGYNVLTSTSNNNSITIGYNALSASDLSISTKTNEQKFGGFCKRCKAFDKDAPLDNKGQCFCYNCFQP